LGHPVCIACLCCEFSELEKLESTRTSAGDYCTAATSVCNAASFLSPQLSRSSSDNPMPSAADDMWWTDLHSYARVS